LEVADVLRENGAVIVGFSSIVDRSGGRFKPGDRFYASVEMDIPIYRPDECPICRKGIPVIEPGSRRLV